MDNKTDSTTKTEIVTFRCSKELKDELVRLAKEDRRSLSDYLGLLVEEVIEERAKKESKRWHIYKTIKKS